MNPIYIRDLSVPRYGNVTESEDGEEILLEGDRGRASRCPRGPLPLTVLLCILLLSSNITLLILYLREVSIIQEEVVNQTQLRQEEANLSLAIALLREENAELSRHYADLERNDTEKLADNTALWLKLENLTQIIILCQEENRTLTTAISNLTTSYSHLKDQVRTLNDLNTRLQRRVANLSATEEQMLKSNMKLVSVESTLVERLQAFEGQAENLTAEVVRLSSEDHDLALSYAVLEKHCHLFQSSLRGHHHSRASNYDFTGKSIYFPFGARDAKATFLVEQYRPLSAFTICVTYSAHLAWGISLLPSSDQVDMAAFECQLYTCKVIVNTEDLTIKVGGSSKGSTSWVHTCVTWASSTGTVHLWVDGVGDHGLKGSRRQMEQPTMAVALRYRGGSGLVTDLHVWDQDLSDCDLQALSSGIRVTSGNVINWHSLASWHLSEHHVQLKALEDTCKDLS